MITTESHQWRLFRSTYNPSWPNLLPEPLRQQSGSVRALQERHHVREGQWFLIGPDGRPDVEINRFLASPEMRVNRRDHTQRKYAYSIKGWLNFLSHLNPPRQWHEATSSDIDSFKFWRMTDEHNLRRVTGAPGIAISSR